MNGTDRNGWTFTFLQTSVDTGLTRARIASTTNDDEKIRRNQARARRAYDTILHFMKQAEFTRDETVELAANVEKLKRELQALRERV